MIYRTFIIAALLVFTYGCSDSNNDDGFDLSPVDPPANPIQPTNPSQPEWLYVQTAETAQMTTDIILEIPFTRDVFAFADRPDRKQAYLTAFEFEAFWSEEGANSFSEDPPNPVLTWQVGEEQREAELIIKNSTVYSDGVQESLLYKVTLEAGQMPDAQMSSVSLFVAGGTPAPSYLLVQNGNGGTLSDTTLTLTDVSSKTGWFTDRPHRGSGQRNTEDFVALWDEGGTFADDPPNADFTCTVDSEVVNFVVELTSPAMPGDDLSYSVNAVGDTVLPEIQITCEAESHLFIDSFVNNCEPGCAWGLFFCVCPWDVDDVEE